MPGIPPRPVAGESEVGSRTSGTSHASGYNRARHYGRETGRWTSVDPLWPDESAYGYVGGNPTTFVDPSGMIQFDNCPPEVEKWIEKLCNNLRGIDKTAGAIDNCITKLSWRYKTKCPSFSGKVHNCMKDFCKTGKVTCFRASLPGFGPDAALKYLPR